MSHYIIANFRFLASEFLENSRSNVSCVVFNKSLATDRVNIIITNIFV